MVPLAVGAPVDTGTFVLGATGIGDPEGPLAVGSEGVALPPDPSGTPGLEGSLGLTPTGCC